MKKNLRTKTLTLSTEAVRALSTEEIVTVRGAALYRTQKVGLSCVLNDCMLIAF